MDLLTAEGAYYVLIGKENEEIKDLETEYYYKTKYKSFKIE